MPGSSVLVAEPEENIGLCRLLAHGGVDAIEASGNGTSVAGVRAGHGGALAESASYTFTGDDPLGSGSFLVGVQIGDPNLATHPQIQPVALRVNCRMATTIILR